MNTILAASRSSRTIKAVALVLGIVVLGVLGWAVDRWREYESLEPLRNGVSEIKEGNYDSARMLIAPFANQGNPHAAKLMGQLYAFGLGVPTDSTRAEMWFRIAECECSDPGRYEFDIGLDMARGFAGRKDVKLASEWLRRAAEAGNRRAQLLISNQAQARAEGFDVPEDVSRFWRDYLAAESRTATTQ